MKAGSSSSGSSLADSSLSGKLMSSSLWSVDQSLAPTSELTDEQQLRLTDVLDRWLMSLEQGTPLAQRQLLAEHPDLAEALKKYFHSLADLHEMAAGFGHAAEHVKKEEKSDDDSEKQIGDFELLHEIGRGGMGVVYEARQISLDRRVAIKILPFASVLDSRQIARFKHEAQAAAQLHHEHIVPVFAIGVERGVHYYAMQLVNGQSLDRWIESQNAARFANRTRQLPREHFENVARLGMQAAQALHAAHEYGIVHRDIKPSNLMIEPGTPGNEHAGDTSKCWVTDFGLARVQREVSLTRTGDLVGTLRYMSPEQAKGSLVDHRTDVYSLGATLYELAGLTAAYREDHSVTLLQQIDSHDPTPLRQLRPEIPADLANIIHKALSRQRDDRYATAADFAADLQRFLKGEPTAAHAPSLLERCARFSQRHARAMSVTLALLLLLVFGLTIGSALIFRETQRANQNLARAQQSSHEARDLLDQFGRQLSERLAHIAGAEEVRRDLLLSASDYYRRFITDSQGDPTQQTDLAIAYGCLASLLDDVGTADEALATHQEAVGFLQQLARDNASETSRQRLAVAQNNLALALRRAGKFTEAKEQLEQAIKTQHALTSAAPRNKQYAVELAKSYGNLGLVLQDAADDSAATAFQSSVDAWSSLVAGDAQYQSNLAAALSNLAGVYSQTEPSRAIRLYEKAIQSQIASAAAGTIESQRELALTNHNLAAVLSRSQQFAAAATAYRQAIEIQSALVARAPAQTAIKRELAISCNNLGLVLTRQKEAAAAETSFAQASEWQQQLLAANPTDAALHSNHGSTLSNWAVALSQQGDFSTAVEKLNSAVKYQEQALALSPGSTKIETLLGKHQALLATTKQKMDLPVGAAVESTTAATLRTRSEDLAP